MDGIYNDFDNLLHIFYNQINFSLIVFPFCKNEATRGIIKRSV